MRVVLADDGELEIGRTLPGRGAWLCAEGDACLELAVQRKAFTRALKAPVDGEAAERLRTKRLNSARMEGRAGSESRGATQSGKD